MAIRTSKNNEWVARITALQLNQDKDKPGVLNIQNLKGILSYLSYLYRVGEISDKTFENLVTQACSVYIENEIESRLQEALEKVLSRWLQSSSKELMYEILKSTSLEDR